MKLTDFSSVGEKLYSQVLPNGLTVNLIPKPGFNSAYAVFAVNYGGAHRRFRLDGEALDTPAGVAHFLEHKMFDMPDGDSAMTLLSANGADPNAFTSSGVTCYYFQGARNFEENLRLLLHFVSTPYFTDETVAKEQGIIAQEIRMGEDNPGSAIYYQLLEMLYKNHPVKDKVAGTVESIGKISAKTLYDCHRAFYIPANMTVCAEGDFDVDKILSVIEEELPAESGVVPLADFGDGETQLPLETVCRREMAVSAPQFLIGAKLLPDRSGAALLRQHIVSQLALRMLLGYSSPFYSRLYNKGLISRDFGYDVDFSAGTATISIGGESRDPMAVLDELNAEVAAVSQKGFDAEYFTLAKRASVGARLRGLEDFENVCLSVALGVFDDFCALDSFKLLEDVDVGECVDFIRSTLTADKLAISIIEPKRA